MDHITVSQQISHVRAALRIVTIYAVVSGLWIIGSDRAVELITRDPDLITRLSIIKGWAFVAVTAGLLFVLIQRLIVAERRALDRLRRSEEWRRITLDSIGDAVIATDAQGRVVHLNPVAEALTGWQVAEAAGCPLEEIFVIRHEGDGAPVENPVAKVLRQGGVVGLANHTELVARDGVVRPIADSAAPIRTSDGRVVGVVMVFHDQSAARAAERALCASEERFRLLVSSSPIAIHLYGMAADGALRLEVANPAGLRLCAEGASSPVGGRLEEVLPAVVSSDLGESCRRIAESGGIWEARDFALHDGAAFDVCAFRTGPRHVAITGFETTARQRAERQRELLFDLCPDLLLVMDLDGRVLQANRAWSRILDWSPEELTWRSWQALVHPDDVPVMADALRQVTEGAVTRSTTFRGVHRNGSYRIFSWSGSALTAERLVIAIGRDITEQQRLEDQLRQASKMEAVGQLAGGIAHDFNNVLAGILGYAELLEPVVADQPRPRKHALAIIGAAKRAATLTGQLLAFSRKGKRHAAPLDVHHAATAACDLLRIGLDPRIVLDVHLEARHATITGDAGMIQNMVLNLGLNARDAMHEGGTLTISTEDVSLPADHSVLCAAGLPGGSYLHLAVSDTGCGMSEAVQARAFEPFFTTKPLGRGTGLGLPSVYGTVRDHGGIVTITSAVGVGTTVHVYLPVNGMTPAESSCAQGAKRSARPARVLVADDEATLRDLLADFLGERGIEVVQAADGEEAVARVVNDGLPFDLIILDMMMPRLDGRGALNAIHAHAPQVPVLMCSGHIDDTLVDDLKAEGLTAFIAKPFTCDQLVAAIEGTLATNPAVN